jgi:class 3 adenylate cyclase
MGVRTTVVFTDLTGSTSAFESLGNAKATKAVTQLTRWICSLFESRGGRVIKTLGDGVLAVFPDAAVAVDAVVEMQRAHQKRLMQQSPSERLPIRVGVATGEVVIVDGDCFGDAVNVASRLSDLSGPHEIWVNSTDLDYTLRANGIRFRLLGPISVRGRVEPCMVYQVGWHEDEPTDFLTMQADLDPAELASKGDVLGREVELVWMDLRKTFKAFELPVQIGRISNCEFLVNDGRVSRTHARIAWRNGSIMLVDVSSYGTWIRFEGTGSDVLLRREECVLHGNGELALGAPFADSSVPTVKFRVR